MDLGDSAWFFPHRSVLPAKSEWAASECWVLGKQQQESVHLSSLRTTALGWGGCWRSRENGAERRPHRPGAVRPALPRAAGLGGARGRGSPSPSMAGVTGEAALCSLGGAVERHIPAVRCREIAASWLWQGLCLAGLDYTQAKAVVSLLHGARPLLLPPAGVEPSRSQAMGSASGLDGRTSPLALAQTPMEATVLTYTLSCWVICRVVYLLCRLVKQGAILLQ